MADAETEEHSAGPTTPRSVSMLTTASAQQWAKTPAVEVALLHALPHRIVPQILRADIATFLPPACLVVRSLVDEQHSVDTFTIADDTADEADLTCVASFPYVTDLDVGPSLVVPMRQLAQLTQLRRLHLRSHHEVDAAAMQQVAMLTELTYLDLGGVIGDPACFQALTALTQLRHLDLSACEVVNAKTLSEVAKLTALQELILSECRHVDALGLAEVSKLPDLRFLDLECCRDVYGAAELAEISKLPRLEHLDLSYCVIVDYGDDASGFAEIVGMPQLRRLDLRCCSLGKCCLAEIAKLTQLRHLDLSHCDVPVSCVVDAVARLPQLRFLNIRGCPRGSDESDQIRDALPSRVDIWS